MNKIIGAAVAAVGALLLTAAPAHADEESYLTDLANHDFTGPADSALQMGYDVCTDVEHGVPELTTVQAIYENTGEGVTEDDAYYIYDAAVIHLC
jgi:hypothetical protein